MYIEKWLAGFFPFLFFESPTILRFHNSTGRLGESPFVIQYMDCNSLAEKLVGLKQRQ